MAWSQHAPYDAIIVTAAAENVPHALLNQLAENGHMVIPVSTGSYAQTLQLIIKHKKNMDMLNLETVLFVPLLRGTS